MRRKGLCEDPNLCQDSPGNGERCDSCPLTRLDNALQNTFNGQLLQRALNKLSAIKMGVTLTLDDILAEEMYTMSLIEEERDKLDREPGNR